MVSFSEFGDNGGKVVENKDIIFFGPKVLKPQKGNITMIF